MDIIVASILPYLGNMETYLNAKEISTMYELSNKLDGIEYVVFYLVVGLLSSRIKPAVGVIFLFLVSRELTFLPSVIIGRLFELSCVVVFYEYYRGIKNDTYIILFSFALLIARLHLHYSIPAESLN
jgi:hypothetical protein